MPESLTRKNAANHQRGWLQIGTVAGVISERWPASNRNPGRLHVGTPGRIKSESAGGALTADHHLLFVAIPPRHERKPAVLIKTIIGNRRN